MQTKEKLTENFEYLGLKDEYKEYILNKKTNIEFEINRIYSDKEQKVYKYINIDDIEIILTPHNKDDDLKEKINDGIYIQYFLENNDENLDSYKRKLEFNKIVDGLNKEKIEEIEKEQQAYNEKIPFNITYSRAHMWNIYYDLKTQKYFMLVCLKEADFNELLYLVKQKVRLRLNSNVGSIEEKELDKNKDKNKEIELKEEKQRSDDFNKLFMQNDKDKKIAEGISGFDEEKEELTNKYIYAPISYLNISDNFLNTTERMELENYFWYFTKNWPMIYEVYDKKNEYNLVILGETDVYERIKSDYRFVLNKKEDAIRLYKFLKAMFSLDSNTDNYINFTPVLKKNLELGFFVDKIDKQVEYEDIPILIYQVYSTIYEMIKTIAGENKEKTIKLNLLKKDLVYKEKVYKEKQNEVVIYLECKKSFTKKIKYFFKKSPRLNPNIKNAKKKSVIKQEIKQKQLEREKQKPVDNTVLLELEKFEVKDYYTIEEFNRLYALYKNVLNEQTKLKQDIKGLRLALVNINNKLANVEIYLQTIDEHKRNIFDFWKFTNKDNKLSLDEWSEDLEESEKQNDKIEAVFNFDMDIEELGQKMDSMQRKKLSKQEIDSIYLADTDFLTYMNMIKNKTFDEYLIITFIDTLRERFEQNSKYLGEDFDLFGSGDTHIKTRYLGTNEFRELDRNWIKAFGFNKNIDPFSFLEKLNEKLKYLDESFAKIKLPVDLSVYKIIPANMEISNKNLEVMNLDIRAELMDYSNDKKEDKIKLIKINLKKDTPLLFYTNIMFYENLNKTLPCGNHASKKVLIDLEKIKLDKKAEKSIYVNKYFLNKDNIFTKVDIIEYDMK